MHNFITTTIVNNKLDSLSGLPKFKGVPAAAAVPGVSPEVFANFEYLRVGKFYANRPDHSKVVKCYRNDYLEPKVSSVEIVDVLAGGGAGQQGRFAVKMRLLNDVDSRFAIRDSYYYNKILYFETRFDAAATSATVAADLVKKINKWQMDTGMNILKCELLGTTGVKISSTFVQANIDVVEYQEFRPNTTSRGGDWVAMKKYDKNVNPADGVHTMCEEGFGYYKWMYSNLVALTPANTDPFGLNSLVADSTNLHGDTGNAHVAIPGGKYTQFTLVYLTEEGLKGTDVVGQRVTSETSHIFYVESAHVADFVTELGNAGITITPAL